VALWGQRLWLKGVLRGGNLGIDYLLLTFVN
jgi:hypothetical protein